MIAIDLAERGLIPDALIRLGVRRLCARKLAEESAHDPEVFAEAKARYIAQWSQGPVAVHADAANAQHYELPPSFFELVLGSQLKYSCALFPSPDTTLEQAEIAMLEQSCERAGIRDGMRILDLGCGWGSMTLHLARRYPACRITAVSNSRLQREHILRRAAALGIAQGRVEVVTADINDYDADRQFDRIVSVEMLEHVRNHAEVFRRARRWLAEDGAMFVHVFCHRELAYPYEDRGEDDWMARYFFTGGVMPSFDLFLHYPRDLQVQRRWWVSGRHYARTAECWLARLDASRSAALAELERHYPPAEAARWLQRWRMFFLAVAEFFGYDGGRQWGVGHYLLRPAG